MKSVKKLPPCENWLLQRWITKLDDVLIKLCQVNNRNELTKLRLH